MNDIFEKHKKALEAAGDNGDIERSHSDADDIICLVALDAAAGKLSVNEVQDLIDIYDNIPKWFA